MYLQVLCNSLWYLTNQQETINSAAMRNRGVQPVPTVFDKFTGYNNTKRKKMKSQPMSSSELNSHSQALYSLLLRPVLNSSPMWVKAHDEIKALADCLISYKNYLDSKNTEIKELHRLPYPVRTVAEYTTVEHRPKDMDVKEQYKKLDEAVINAGSKPIFFYESVHLVEAFQSNLQRFRYLQNLKLSVPVDVYRFCPGGSTLTSVCITQVQEGRSEPEMLTQTARVALQLKDGGFREFHTRAQKKMFKERLQHVAKVLPSVADLIYKELSLDASAALHPDTQERLRLIFLGESDLLVDLRHVNPGRPSGHFDTFFKHLSAIVEDITAADERRHNIAHMSEWISLSDLIEKAAEKCPEATPIPSKSLVRLQFAPRNPYIKTAWNFTSAINIQYKIQRRQLRATHLDQHYCACIYKYLRERAVELVNKCCLVCCDDKAKVAVGEPGFSISTGVRGKKTLAPSTTTLSAGDHDMSKASLTPSVILKVDVPQSSDQSFVQGQVSVSVNDSVFQGSTPFRHAISIGKSMDRSAKILLKYSDGGVDHRNTLESVKCATICLFKEYDLDMVILARCAPGNSWINPAERVMSILNLGLQNCALEREASTDKEMKAKLKSCGSMKEIREKGMKSEELKQAWTESIEPVQSTVRNRFLRLKLKNTPFQAYDPIREEEIDVFKRHLRELFPDLDLEKALTKINTKKSKMYVEWVSAHCRERQYIFQVRKCKDPSCCLPPTNDFESINWLPDPVLEENKEHFKPYNEVKMMETTEKDRPSMAEKIPKEHLQAIPQTSTGDTEAALLPEHESAMYTAQNARATIACTECSKPRVVYGKQKMSQRQQVLLASLMSEFEYTCGSPLTSPGSALHSKYTTRPGMFCNTPIELCYYSSTLQCPKDLCTYCSDTGAEVDQNLKKKFKTVLPICVECVGKGKKPIAQRPYGKN